MFSTLALLAFVLPVLPSFVLVAAQSQSQFHTNTTIDDQDLSLLTYSPSEDWSHDPLIGWETHFYNRSRSYTWTPGATVSFTFTGSGIYLRGPSAPDQALRRVTLDGEDQGACSAWTMELAPSHVFWGRRDLVYTTHTIVVAHDDSQGTILTLDAVIVEFDPFETPLPYSTTTTTITSGSTSTITPSATAAAWDDISQNRNYSIIVIGIVVPIVFFLVCCFVGLCIYRSRRTRNRQRKRESFKEKLFRSRGGNGDRGRIYLHSPNSLVFLDGGPRSSVESRPMSPRTIGTIASTHYETALDHNNDPTTNNPNLRPSSVNPVNDSLTPPTSASQPFFSRPTTTPRIANYNSASLYIPPAEWDTTPTFLHPPPSSTRVPAPAATKTRSNPRRWALRKNSNPNNPPSAWVPTAERTQHTSNRPSTVFSESDFSHTGSNLQTQQPSQPISVIRSFSAALLSPFTRNRGNAVPAHTNRANSATAAATTIDHNGERSGHGYFRGMNHYNLGIPLNYQPVASATLPTESTLSRRRPSRDGGRSSGARTSQSVAGSPAGYGPGVDDIALAGYLRDHRDVTPSPITSTRVSVADDEKPEKIVESFDGSTIRESEYGYDGPSSWSIGHETLSSPRDTSSPSEDLTRNGSLLSRRMPITEDRSARQSTPPPYSIYIPPEIRKHSR